MNKVATKFSGYAIETDYFPYTETKIRLKETNWWWNHKSRNKNQLKASNYSLDSMQSNSIGFSLENKLQNGEFNFLYYKEDLILYSALRIDDLRQAWIHRGATHPILGKNHVGCAMTILMPHQARVAKSLGCLTYNISFNDYNYKFFKYYKERHYYKSLIDIRGGERFMDAFKWVENITVMYVNQHIGCLDLTRSDIDDILEI